nr:MAK10-like protein [Tanacetum cinerariifolium]
MEVHLAPTQPTQVNKVSTSCEICSGPHDTYYCMEDPEQAFVEYASLRIDEAGGKWYTFKLEPNNLGDNYNPSWRSHPNLRLVPQSFDTEVVCTKGDYREVMFIELIKKNNDHSEGEPEEDGSTTTEEVGAEYFDIFSTRSELAYHKLVPQSFDIEVVCTKGDYREVMFIELIKKNNDHSEGEPEEDGSTTTEEVGAEYFDIFSTRSELAYHNGPHDTYYCMEDPEQAFVEYASLRIDEAGGKWYTFKLEPNNLGDNYNPSWRSHPNLSLENIHVNSSILPDPSVAFITKKVLKSNSFFESLGLVPQSSNTEVVFAKRDDGKVMSIELIRKNDDSSKGEPKEEGSTITEEVGAEYFDIFPTRSELTYHKYLMCSPLPLIFLRNLIIMEGCPLNLKIPCNIGHVQVKKAYIDPNSPLNIMTRMMCNWIMRRRLDPRESSNRGVSNFTRRIKGMHVFIGNFTYIVDFMIGKDIGFIIDPSPRETFCGNIQHDSRPPEGVVRFTNRTDEVSNKMPHMIEQYNSLSDLEKEYTISTCLRNKEDKRRGVEYVMSKILGFYKECLELGPEYATGMDDE